MDKKIETLEASLSDAKTKAEAAGGTDESLNTAVKDAEKALAEAKSSSQDLDKSRFTKRERLLYAKGKIDEQLSGLDSEGKPEDEDQNKPVTVGMLKDIEKQNAQKTALKLAEDIEDETERGDTIKALQTSIAPSGDPQKDFLNARAIANVTKNAQIVEEAERRKSGKISPTLPGAPRKNQDEVFEPTAQERVFMNPPYSLSKEAIIKAREAEQS